MNTKTHIAVTKKKQAASTSRSKLTSSARAFPAVPSFHLNTENKPAQTAILKTGIEDLPGPPIDNMQLYFSSGEPLQLHAYAFKPQEVIGFENTADLMGDKAFQMKYDQPNEILYSGSPELNKNIIQRMALYHGTTDKAASTILKGEIDPEQGGGEFGLGFYTVFSLAQAKHIAMYYWDKEQKYNKSNKGVAVVKISIPDDKWKTLMSTSDENYSVVHKDNNEWFNSRSNPSENRESEEKIEPEEGELEERDDKIEWMPRKKEELEYEEDRDVDLKNDITIGPIKDKQTPYIQVVFGPESAEYLLNNKETLKSIEWQEAYDKAIGTGIYNQQKSLGLEDLGSMKKTEKVKSLEFIEQAKDKKLPNVRQQFVQNLLGGLNNEDIPNQVDEYLIETGIKGNDKGERIYKYITSGIKI